MGSFAIRSWQRRFGWGAVALMALASAVMFWAVLTGRT